jgi:hypothetical protein
VFCNNRPVKVLYRNSITATVKSKACPLEKRITGHFLAYFLKLPIIQTNRFEGLDDNTKVNENIRAAIQTIENYPGIFRRNRIKLKKSNTTVSA